MTHVPRTCSSVYRHGFIWGEAGSRRWWGFTSAQSHHKVCQGEGGWYDVQVCLIRMVVVFDLQCNFKGNYAEDKLVATPDIIVFCMQVHLPYWNWNCTVAVSSVIRPNGRALHVQDWLSVIVWSQLFLTFSQGQDMFFVSKALCTHALDILLNKQFPVYLYLSSIHKRQSLDKRIFLKCLRRILEKKPKTFTVNMHAHENVEHGDNNCITPNFVHACVRQAQLAMLHIVFSLSVHTNLLPFIVHNT